MDEPRHTPNVHENDPDPLTEPEQLPNDDDLGPIEPHRGPSEAATADIEKRHKDAKSGRAPEDSPDY